MPLSKLQTEILLILAEHRNPESYVAGASALNQNGPRYSGDIYIFHDQEEAVAQMAIADTALLVEHGFTFNWIIAHLDCVQYKKRKGRLRPPSEPPARGPVPLTP